MSDHTCSVDGCDQDHSLRVGYCDMHYQRVRRTGSPGDASPTYTPRGLPCIVEGCTRSGYKRGYCRMHHSRIQRTGEVGGPESNRRDALERDEAGRKLCPSCRQWLPESEFTTDKKRPDGRNLTCRTCARSRDLRDTYGITPSDVDLMLAEQGGCAICGTVNPGKQGWCVDHDHACCSGWKSCGRCVRGVLCRKCNLMLGMVSDSVPVLSRAIDYLATHAI